MCFTIVQCDKNQTCLVERLQPEAFCDNESCVLHAYVLTWFHILAWSTEIEFDMVPVRFLMFCLFGMSPTVENENHCDFVKLREMLIRVNMEDLREQTHTRHYELYRRCKLEEMGFKDTDPDSKPFRYQTQGSFLSPPFPNLESRPSSSTLISFSLC